MGESAQRDMKYQTAKSGVIDFFLLSSPLLLPYAVEAVPSHPQAQRTQSLAWGGAAKGKDAREREISWGYPTTHTLLILVPGPDVTAVPNLLHIIDILELHPV